MTRTGWFERLEGEPLVLRVAPRLASWNEASDPDQLRLRAHLTDTAELVAPTIPQAGLWVLRFDVGLPEVRDLTDTADLDNYAYPLAAHLRHERLVSVWCSKSHAQGSHVLAAPARATTTPLVIYSARTSVSSTSTAYKQQVRASLIHGANATELPPGPVRLQIAFVVGARRNWINLWKPTVDALDPLLGRTQPDRDWHPRDGRMRAFQPPESRTLRWGVAVPGTW